MKFYELADAFTRSDDEERKHALCDLLDHATAVLSGLEIWEQSGPDSCELNRIPIAAMNAVDPGLPIEVRGWALEEIDRAADDWEMLLDELSAGMDLDRLIVEKASEKYQ